MDLDLAMEFIDLCIDNYKNGGHSTTKEQEHRYYKLKHQFQDDHEKARLCDGLTKILMNHCGEDGDNEGAVDTLNRISEKARKWDFYYWIIEKINAEFVNAEVYFKQVDENQKLRELIEKWDKDLVSAPLDEQSENWKDHEISDRLEEILKESKK